MSKSFFRTLYFWEALTICIVGFVFLGYVFWAMPDRDVMKLSENAEQSASAEQDRCVGEGEISVGNSRCCSGLRSLQTIAMHDQADVCANCGNGKCNPPEDSNNCPLDCTTTGKDISIPIFLGAGSLDGNSNVLQGTSVQEQQIVRASFTDQTDFSRIADGMEEEISLADFRSILQSWSGPQWIFWIEGVREEGNAVQASKIFYGVQ